MDYEPPFPSKTQANWALLHSSGQTRNVKSNLSKKGKVYFKNPVAHFGSIANHTKVVWSKGWGGLWHAKVPYNTTQDDDWEIEYLTQ